MTGAPLLLRPDVATDHVRQRLTVTGVVQGVGFRPFVHRLANELGLAGFVGNDCSAVFIEIQGERHRTVEFARRLAAEAPPLARVTAVSVTDLVADPACGREFRIVASTPTGVATTPIPPDIAVCDDCVAELFDPRNRRYRHPFATCTNCGPRFTIIRELPYDRPATTMAGFSMCDRCAAEYQDPADRRFHAQPIACPECGPTLWFSMGGRRITGSDAALAAAQRALAAGAVVAIKGIGGYHLACAVHDEAAVGTLRARKARGAKPFAMLVLDLDVARRFAHIDGAEAAVLSSPAHPIVLLRRRRDAPVAEAVAPGNPLLGLMLPYSPLHHLLLAEVPKVIGIVEPPPEALVLTSANRSGEPICFTDDDVEARLPGLCDAILDHDRPIHVPCDDSVVRVVHDGAEESELPLRRSRGYAPLPIDVNIDAGLDAGLGVLAVGGELKNAFCLTDGARAYLSGHLGDMASWETLRAFERAVGQLSEIRGIPNRFAADLHPGYHTRDWAERHGGDRPLDLVQHHHAHVVSLLAEHGRIGEPVVGVAFDGTGYGRDQTIWGGEILVLGPDSHRFERAAHLRAVPLPGGDAAIRNPWRAALSQLWVAGIGLSADLAPVAAATPDELRLTRSQLETGTGCVPCSSAGRLFDAVASLLGVRHRVDYEGQAAIELEALAERAELDGSPVPSLPLPVRRDGVIEPATLIQTMVSALYAGTPPALLAAAFHRALAAAVARAVALVAGPIRLVGLTGGVFQNVLLLRLCQELLQQNGFEVISHRVVPPNDGGLALGQAVISMLTALEEATT